MRNGDNAQSALSGVLLKTTHRRRLPTKPPGRRAMAHRKGVRRQCDNPSLLQTHTRCACALARM